MTLVAAPHKATKMMGHIKHIVLVGLPAIVVAAIAGWLLFPSLAETEPNLTLQAAVTEPTDGLDEPMPPSPTGPLQTALPDAAELSRVSLSRQSFRRGGLGSRALMSFTVRNTNDYPVKDLEIACAFKSRDGHYTTERRRVLAETVKMKSRKAFPMTHIGFVNIKAEKARCSLVTASRA
jgi:hypothetical protein